MERLGLIAGEHPMLFRRCVSALTDRLAAEGVAADWRTAEAHVPELQAALVRQDHEAARRAVVAAAARLRAEGAAVLAMPSWRLQEWSEAIEAATNVPFLRLDHWLGCQLASEGWSRCAFLAHSEAHLRPFVRYRLYGEFEVELLGTNEDAFEAVDAWSGDWTEDPVPPRRRELVLQWIRKAWALQHFEVVVAERAELARLAATELGFRRVIDLEQVWVDGLVRRLLGQPDPKPKPRALATVDTEALRAAQAEVCRRLNLDPRNTDFTTGRDGEIALVVPDSPAAAALPGFINGVQIIRS